MLEEPASDSAGLAERVLHIADRQQLIDTLDREATYLLDHNNYCDSIGTEGVHEAVLVSALRVEDLETGTSAHLLVADDGSSRISSCHELLGHHHETAAFQHAENPELLRRAVTGVLAMESVDHEELEPQDVRRMYALEIPAAIVIGFRPDNYTDGENIARAIAHKVGKIHVDPPEPWSDEAQTDKKLELALNECTRRDKAAPDFARYLAGTITPEAAQALGFDPMWDSRSVVLLHFFSASTNTFAINEGIRGLYGRKIKPERGDRLELAVEAAIRPYRLLISAKAADTSRRAMIDIFSMPELKDISQEWVDYAMSDLDSVRDHALRELKKEPGSATWTLMTMGAYWIVMKQQLRATSGGQHDDKRTIPQLLRGMARSKRGVWQFWQAIQDGRTGAQPLQVRSDGSRVINTHGKYVAVDDAWIRKTWPPVTRQPVIGKDSTTTVATPDGELRRRRDEFRDAIDAAANLIESFGSITETNGRQLIEYRGLPSHYTQAVISTLKDIEKQLNRYEFIWEKADRSSETGKETLDES